MTQNKDNNTENDQAIADWLGSIAESKLNTEDVQRALRYAKEIQEGLATIRTFAQGVSIFGSARFPEDHKYCKKAEELGCLLAENGHTVITGGGPGIMQAANKGAYEAGGRSVGLNVKLPWEQELNPYVTDSYYFKHFFPRKVMLTFSAKTYVFFPGGFGTMDEFTEILELMHTNKMPKMPIFLYCKSFWRPLDHYFRAKFVSNGVITAKATSLYKMTDDINEIVKAANKIGHPNIHHNLYNDYHIDPTRVEPEA